MEIGAVHDNLIGLLWTERHIQAFGDEGWAQ